MRRRSIGKFAGDRSGTTAVEFALIALPFFLLIIGIVEVSRLYWTRQSLEWVAVAGARCMGVGNTNCATSGTYSASLTLDYVKAQGAKWKITLKTADITLNNAATCGGVSGFSKVTLTHTFNTVAPDVMTWLVGGKSFTTYACYPNQS